VELRIVPTRAVVASDPVLLGSTLENLVRNAVKFTAPGGRILLGLRRRGQLVSPRLAAAENRGLGYLLVVAELHTRAHVLVIGGELSRFLRERRQRIKQSCGPGRIYCIACGSPKVPAGKIADWYFYE
jgi:hypothetical protein